MLVAHILQHQEYRRWRWRGENRIMRKYVDYKVMPDELVIDATHPLYRYCKDP